MTLTSSSRIVPVVWSGVPYELRAERRWAIWRAELDSKGRLAKMPYQASSTKHKASSTKPASWGTFDQAKAALDHGEGDGLLFALGDGFAGVDFDGIRNVESGDIEPDALAEIEALASYSEVSVSGMGVHVLVRAAMPNGRRGVKRGNFEAYSAARFFTVTGCRLPEAGGRIEERQGELEAFFRRHWPANVPTQHEPIRPLGRVAMDDAELINRATAAKNGAEFAALWAGEIPAGRTWSEAAASLCFRLAFWTAKDAARMDAMFRQSGLMAEKWDSARGSETWGGREIARAIAEQTEIYTMGRDRATSQRSGLHLIGKEGGKDVAIEAADVVRTSMSHVAVAEDVGNWDSEEQGEVGEVGEGKGDTESTASTVGERLPQVLPLIQTNDVQLRRPVQAMVGALVEVNRNRKVPLIYTRGNVLVRVLPDEQGEPIIEPLDEKALTWLATGSANFVKMTKEGVVSTYPPPAVVRTVLGMGRWAGIPTLRGIVSVPTLRQDGSVLDQPGYDAATELIYLPPSDFELPPIPVAPTALEVAVAVDYVEQELMADFPFVDQASRANAWALLLSPIIRSAIVGCVPLCLVDAPSPGSGKSLFANMVSLIATGKYAGAMVEPAGNEDDWRKSILAVLLNGRPFILIYNVARDLQSPSLAAALTATMYEGRQLQYTKWLRLPQRATWVATGNNIKIGGDLPRRCYLVRLNTKLAKPWERSENAFRHPKLLRWVAEHRDEVVAALLTVIRGWIVAGRPVPQDPPGMGNFEEWAEMTAGVLAFAGIEGFLGNRTEMYKRAADEANQWQAFIEALRETWPDEQPFTIADVARMLAAEQQREPAEQRLVSALPEPLAVALASRAEGFSLRVAKAFSQRSDQPFGPFGIRLEQTGQKVHNAVLWRVTLGE